MSLPTDDDPQEQAREAVEAALRAGRWDEAAKAARAAGQAARAQGLYERIWDFRGAAECAREAGDVGGEIRNLVDAGALDEARARALELAAPEAEPAARRAVAEAFEARRCWNEAASRFEALGDLERALACQQRDGALVDAGRLLEALGRLREAGAAYERALEGATPLESARAHAALGRLRAGLRQHERAARHWQTAARAARRAEDRGLVAVARRGLVDALAALGFADAARATWRRLRRADPGLPADLEVALREERARARAAAPPNRDAPTILGGRYRLGPLLGAGASGRVFQATDEMTGREVALKLFFAAPKSGPRTPQAQAYERFVREARVCGGLRHPNLVEVLDFQEELGFFVMELAATTLVQRLGRRLGASQVRRLGLELCAGLAFAHGHGIVHRDLKPANVFFDAAGTAKLGDFGVAHLLELGQTQTGGLIGTLAYMAPEQITGAPLTVGADFYALGVTLFQALAGRLPFLGPDFVAQHLGETAPRLADVAPEAFAELGARGPAWEALLARLLAKTPAERFASVDEVERALDDLEDGRAGILVLGRGDASAAVGATTPVVTASDEAAPATAATAGAATAATAARHQGERLLGETAISRLFLAVDSILDRSVVLERFHEGQPDEETERRLTNLARVPSAYLQRVLSWDRSTRTAVFEAPVGELLAAKLATGTLAPEAAACTALALARVAVHLDDASTPHGALDEHHLVVDEAGIPTLLLAGLGPVTAGATPSSQAAADAESLLLLGEKLTASSR